MISVYLLLDLGRFWCESREGIQARKKICLPLKLIYRTYLNKQDTLSSAAV